MSTAITPAQQNPRSNSNAARTPVPVTVARGDGIGPDIMAATLRILEQAGATLALEEIQIGEAVYSRGISAGIEPSAWESLRRTRVFLKAPITTPQGGGFKSLNVTTRKTLGLFANVRPCVAYHPFIATRHPGMDVVIVRENEEDTYAGIEHQQTPEVVQCLKLISRPGCERIIRYAFEYARRNNRKHVACFTKDNIMKLTDGLFHKLFDEIKLEYPEIEAGHWIIDIGSARLADAPEQFDVIVTPNLYGDVISDIAAEIAGSVGLAGSANIGDQCAMFEAIHGSAPRMVGQDRANPSGLLHAAIMMLVHIGQAEVAERVHNAWLRTIEDGVHTPDIFTEGQSTRKVGTLGFADAVIERLGQRPEKLAPVSYSPQPPIQICVRPAEKMTKTLVGVDVFLDWDDAGRSAPALAKKLETLASPGLRLKMITNRGVKVWPDGFPETFCTDHWRCRFMPEAGGEMGHAAVVGLLTRVAAAGLDFIKTEHLYAFNGQPGYTLGQGE